MFASISASSSARSGRDTGSRSHALRAESSLADAPWTRPKSPGKENVHGAIPLQQAVQGAPAQGQARGQGGSQARAAREGGGGGRRRHRLESGGRHHPPPGPGPERSRRGGIRAGRRGGAGRIGPFWHPNIGQVYQLLHELERRGLVVRRDEGAGSRARRLFRLTPRGERALGTWLTRRPAWPAPLREEILVRLLAAERGGPAAVLAQLERQEVEYHRYLSLGRPEAARAGASVPRRL